ncbi:MAG: tetratricopeptide repeat protein [Sphingobium sp.]|uniref:tetratricopeptide repeat protein n=1 Tax=Sphingobium sp. TaxID=1912891 RepID=UPI0029BCB12E|nr:tetratricopeptide repeat protein [Sphingobium sp.]MDX3908465.1 tetratricopeptide repeat protein [Sphingobium sp.]
MKRARLALCIGVAVAGCLAIAMPVQQLLAGSREDARPMLQRGLAALAKGDPRAARVELMNAIRADPSWPASRTAQARVMLTLGDGRGARAELERARELGATPGSTRHLMAHALLLSGEPALALSEARAPDVIGEQAGYAARIEACAQGELGRTQEAAAAFDRAVALAPEDAATWIDLSRFQLGAGNRAAALVASDRAIALAPRSPEAILLRAELIRSQYGLKASLPWFEQALAIDRNYLPALIEYAATLADYGQAGRMLSLTRRVLALDANNPRAFLMQAVMAARAGNMDLARRMLAKVGNRLDGQPATLLLRGILHLDGGNATLAAEALATLVERQPFNFQARLLYGRALLQSGQLPEARAALVPLAGLPDADAYTLQITARVYEALGDREAAEVLLARAATPQLDATALLPLDPDPNALGAVADASPDAAGPNISYIRALLARGRADTALARASSLRDANRGAPEAHVALGDTLAQVGRWDRAAQSYAAAANLSYSQSTALRLSIAWNRSGQTAQAEEALALYLEQNPNSVAANRLAATAWMRSGDWKRAAEALEVVRARIGNGDALLIADLAWAYLGLGDVRRAVAYSAHAYRLMPASPITADAYGWMLFKAGGRHQASIDLLEKAVSLAPANSLLAHHLKVVRVGQGTLS